MPGPDYFGGENESEKPDYFKDTNKPKKANWRKHENDVAKRTGDQTNRSSGAGHGRTGQTRARRSVSPGDNMGTIHLRECKATRGGGITIKKEWLEQLIEQALRMGRRPVLEIRLEGATLPVPQDWVLIPALDFDEMNENA
jgi:Holliday junction resolvase